MCQVNVRSKVKMKRFHILGSGSVRWAAKSSNSPKLPVNVHERYYVRTKAILIRFRVELRSKKVAIRQKNTNLQRHACLLIVTVI